ncbi:hypothetical protein A3A71_00730 [Candidatus Berkelbacteria bacterium RIFCSPLOWO2_01_FULL_50_28]|uniref:ABC3 transporter permease protein domain-containing protein n=1 Tax=Candidatus Berkelbacteria bacterium RIFCSPLOWO2_01_FULL_50_28 TaxID=1797471 RepID=A0A1F5EAX6_9BACT|nr:MAG: hypothetical protein A2807_00985 [Candidatus Berkelbacteria bacterium RIFCSPHIGHO2_01_FULL_50_36]OGD62892.1 MAG: hypothetical protein A3F39_03995 [Candidatus Berkelbacteria bacterium RIFCSPHIGHO2_12_FULL_50_11]OGD64567.1 MAG: hypothetical protein A3A71_00730 [Candidatus Berkelbacteria bacterium RIFCSPLOWO2_01_FULL_50_28]
MTWKDIISLGFRNLTSRRSRTLLTIGGVAVGVTAVIFLVSIGYGIQRLAIRETLQSKSLSFFDVKVGTGDIGELDSKIVNKITSFNNVKGIHLQLETPAKLTLPSSSTKADVIALFNSTTYLQQTDLTLKKGRLFADDKGELLISDAVLTLLSLPAEKVLNSKITFQPLMRGGLLAGKPKTDEITFTVVGIIDDRETPYLSAPIQPVVDAYGAFAFSAAKIEVENVSEIAQTRQQIADLGGLQTEYVGDIISQLNGIFSVVRTVLAGFGLIATFVAALGMFNTLSVSLMERTREIGVMKTLGTKRRDVWKLFLVEGMLISILGGIGGIALGLGVGYGLNGIVNLIAKATGNATTSFYYAPPLFLLLIIGLIILLGALVGLIPARRATKISPLEALRYE